jgi:hypothetical protein
VTAERAIQSLDIRRIQHLTAGSAPQQRQEHPHAPLHQAMQRSGDRSLGILLDHLRNHQVRPDQQAWASTSTTLACPKRLAHDIDIGRQPIGHKQQWAKAGASCDHCHQTLNQVTVAMGADRPAQPQARADHQREGHPHDTSLGFETNLVGLHLHQLARLDNLMVMHSLTLRSGGLDPVANCLSLKAEGGLDSRNGTTVPDQGDHLRDDLLVGATAKEERSGTLAEGFATHDTAIARWSTAMNPDVALAKLSPCGTVQVGAEYGLRIDGTPPSACKHRRVSPDPHDFSRFNSQTTV